MTVAMNSVPKEDLEWEFKLTPEMQREREEKQRMRGTKNEKMISIESNGDISGITEIFYNPAENHRIGQGLTAVLEKYQGRGLGKILKAKMLLDVKEKYPSVEFFDTDNVTTNAPMLGINTKMGFKPYKIWVGYKFTVDELKKLYPR